MGRFKPFAACVFPAVFAFALSGIYAIVDGFFVGRSIGDTGLSAINIAYPVTALIQAAGTGTGMGGAVMYSVRLAEKRDSEAENFMKGVFFYLALTGILLTVILFPLTDPLLSLMGADGELMKPGREYLSVIVLGSVFQVFGTGVVPLIRNQGKSVQAMYCMIGGFVTNIFLDYLFVWVLRLGMAGAAWASVAGQAVTMAGGLLCMRGQKIPVGIPRQALSVFFSIWRIGLAPFGITMCPMISLLLMNRASLQYGGSEGVACYACIAYVITIMYLILQGVGDGSQPLMSRFYGEDNKKRGPHYADHGVCSRRRHGSGAGSAFVLVQKRNRSSVWSIRNRISGSWNGSVYISGGGAVSGLSASYNCWLLRHRTDPIFLYDRLWRTHIFSPSASCAPGLDGIKGRLVEPDRSPDPYGPYGLGA